MKFNHKLLKELGIGVVSLALVTPLVLNGMQSSPVHADYQFHDATARYFEKADSRIPKSEKEHDRKLGARADASEQRYEQNLIRRDPSSAGMYAFEPDNSAKTKALIRKALIKHPKLFAKDTNMLKKYHVKYRHVRRSNHRRHGESLAQFYADVKKSDDNTPAKAKAQSAKLGRQLQNTEDKNEIKLVKNDPGEAYIDAQDMKSLQPSVRAVVKKVYPRDVKKDLVPQLNGRYLHHRHVRIKKHVTGRHHTHKHTNKKRSHHKSRKATNRVR